MFILPGGISLHQVYATDNGDVFYVFYVFFDCDTSEVPVMKYYGNRIDSK